MKFESSPTPPVVDDVMKFRRFFMKQTHTPYHGPREKDANNPGSSDISSFIKNGIKGTEKFTNISINAMAERIAVITMLLVFDFNVITPC